MLPTTINTNLIVGHQLVVPRQMVGGHSVGKQVLQGRVLLLIRLVANVVPHEADREGPVGVRVGNVPPAANVDEAISAELWDQNEDRQFAMLKT